LALQPRRNRNRILLEEIGDSELRYFFAVTFIDPAKGEVLTFSDD
jgi:hypothetical protein